MIAAALRWSARTLQLRSNTPSAACVRRSSIFLQHFNQQGMAASFESKGERVGLVWFKHTDQRLHDNEVLTKAHEENDSVVHVFCFDPHWFGSTAFGFPKTGPHRARFLLQSVANLRQSLEAKGSSLVIRMGKAEHAIPALCAETSACSLYSHREVCSEELDIDAAVERGLRKQGCAPLWHKVWGGTMYHIDDLPFDPQTETPAVFTAFRKTVEKNSPLREPLPTPAVLKPAPFIKGSLPMPAAFRAGAAANEGNGTLPTLAELGVAPLPPVAPFSEVPPVPPSTGPAQALALTWLGSAADGGKPVAGGGSAQAPGSSDGAAQLLKAAGITPPPAIADALDVPAESKADFSAALHDPRAAHTFLGGEAAALARLQGYIWDRDCLRTYKDTRNGLVGADYSSKFSPWLAHGNISPRLIAQHVASYEAQRVANKSTYWMLFELLWRDFFRFSALKWGTTMFWLSGPQRSTAPRTWLRDGAKLAAWAWGRTGYPFVDANMRELAATGFMSNRGRQNVASFFVKDLGMDWRLGAELFESLLLDHDPASNYGNWTYVAGVGADPRADRYFLIPKQSRNYDGEGEYMRLWCPEVAGAATQHLHDPRHAVLGDPSAGAAAYPRPIVTLMAHRGQPKGAARGAGRGAARGAGRGRGAAGGGGGGSGGGRRGKGRRRGRVQHDGFK